MTIGDTEVNNRLRNTEHVLFEIDKIVEWKSINQILSKTDYRLKNKTGRDNYEPLRMFKILIIKMMYNFSYRQIETELHYNLAYIKFCGFSLEDSIPDHSTIARWFEHFMENDVFTSVFDDFNNQLIAANKIVKSGVVVDATLEEAYARPRKTTHIETEPTGDKEVPQQDLSGADGTKKVVDATLNETESIDPDARWVKKGKRYVYGYKIHAGSTLDGIFLSISTTPANVYDGNMLNEVLVKSGVKDGYALTDKGYCSEANSKYVVNLGLSDGIMSKKPPKQDMPWWDVLRNKAISQGRYVIERSFGLLKRKFNGGKTIFIGLKKTHNLNVFRAFGHNLIRSLALP
jgi:IS5 family transposase